MARFARSGLGAPASRMLGFATAQADLGTRTRGEAAAHPLGWLLKPFAPEDVVATARAAMVLVRQRSSGG